MYICEVSVKRGWLESDVYLYRHGLVPCVTGSHLHDVDVTEKGAWRLN